MARARPRMLTLAFLTAAVFTGVAEAGLVPSNASPFATVLASRNVSTTNDRAAVVARLAGKLTTLRGGLAYTSLKGEVRVYDARCRGVCLPLWTAPTWRGLLTVERGVAFVERAHRIDGYATNCRTDGRRCTPVYAIPELDPVLRDNDYLTKHSLSTPVLTGDGIYVAAREMREDAHHGGDGYGRVFALPVSCSPTCPPRWQTPLFEGSVTAQAKGNRVYVASHDGLAVFAKGCQVGGRTCRPLWKGPIDADGSNVILQPVVQDGLVLVRVVHDAGGGDGRPTGVAIFSTRCPDSRCPPRRFIRSEMFGSPPEIVDGRFYLLSRGGRYHVVRAFSTRCGQPDGACKVVWRARIRGVDDIEVLPEESRVYVGPWDGSLIGYWGGSLRAFSLQCRSRFSGSTTGNERPCQQLWTFLPAGGMRSGPFPGPDRTVLLTGRKTVYALPRACGSPCSSQWEWTPPSEMWIAHVSGRRIFLTNGERTLSARVSP